jgi:hypothetical protein
MLGGAKLGRIQFSAALKALRSASGQTETSLPD